MKVPVAFSGFQAMLRVKEEGTRIDGKRSDFGTGRCAQAQNLGKPFGLFIALEITWSFPFLQDNSSIRLALQSQKFPNKSHNHSRIATVLISKERKVNICLLSYFRQLN